MRSSPKSPRVAQMKLFHPLVTTPRWESLAPEIRRHTLQLLTRLLRSCASGLDEESSEGVRDE
jgi:hypothetical protein